MCSLLRKDWGKRRTSSFDFSTAQVSPRVTTKRWKEIGQEDSDLKYCLLIPQIKKDLRLHINSNIWLHCPAWHLLNGSFLKFHTSEQPQLKRKNNAGNTKHWMILRNLLMKLRYNRGKC